MLFPWRQYRLLHLKCCRFLGRIWMSYETLWHVISPKDCVFQVTMVEEKNGRKHCSDVIAFLSFKECTDFKDDASCHIPKYWTRKRQDAQIENSFFVISICHPTLVWQSSHNTLIAHKFGMTNWHNMTNAINWKLAVSNCQLWSCFSFPMSLLFCKLYHGSFVSA